MKQHDKLYKKDKLGRIRVWWMESDDEKYRACSGVLDGQITISGWKYPEGTNEGRANERSVSEQVQFIVESNYTNRLYQGKCHRTINDAEKGEVPFIECMLADKYNPKKHKDFPYISQPKLDGTRCLTSIEWMQTRKGKEFFSSPHIAEELKSFFTEFPDYILDGELYNHDLKNDFEKIMSLTRKSKPTEEDLKESAEKVEYHVYDVITPNPIPFLDRVKFLEDQIKDKFKMIKMVPWKFVHSEKEIEENLGLYLEDGYEGQMLRVNKAYEHNRSKNLIKHKSFEDEEFEIVDIEEGVGNWANYAKKIIIRLEDGTIQKSGMRGNFDFAKHLLEHKDEYIGTDVTVRFQNRTSDNKLRMPVAIKFWKGKRDV